MQIEGWTAAGGLFTIVAGYVFKFYTEHLKSKRQDAVDKAAAANDQTTLLALRDIAQINRDIREGQIAQNGKLTAAVQVNEIYHGEIVRAIQAAGLQAALTEQRKQNQ